MLVLGFETWKIPQGPRHAQWNPLGSVKKCNHKHHFFLHVHHHEILLINSTTHSLPSPYYYYSTITHTSFLFYTILIATYTPFFFLISFTMLQQQIQNNIGMENNSELFQFLVANNPSFFEYSSSTMMQQSFCSSSDNNNNYYHPFEVSEITDTPSQQDRALAALKNHKEAEKRRRERINSHLDHLRTLLPCNSKVIIFIIVNYFIHYLAWKKIS